MKLGQPTSRSLVDVAAPDRLLTVEELVAASGCKPPPVVATIVEPRALTTAVIETTLADVLSSVHDAELVGR